MTAASARIAIACQGGGSHTAFTAGVLGRLLLVEQRLRRRDVVRIGDERVVPPDHKDSNYRMAHESLISKVPIPLDNVYRMRGEADPNEAAKEYGLMLKEHFGDHGLDLVLLGMGDDGHTLSLFPGTKAVTEKDHRVVANYAENSTTGKSWRITMTAPFINKARNVIVMLSGAGKAERLKEVLEGPRGPDRLPI